MAIGKGWLFFLGYEFSWLILWTSHCLGKQAILGQEHGSHLKEAVSTWHTRLPLLVPEQPQNEACIGGEFMSLNLWHFFLIPWDWGLQWKTLHINLSNSCTIWIRVEQNIILPMAFLHHHYDLPMFRHECDVNAGHKPWSIWVIKGCNVSEKHQHVQHGDGILFFPKYHDIDWLFRRWSLCKIPN